MPNLLRNALRYLGQAAAYALTAAILGVFSFYPTYQHFPPGLAQVRLSVSHAAARVGECHRLTPEELEQLAPNMRKPFDCPRGRLPLRIDILLDGAVVYHAALPPTGLSGDGPARIYQSFRTEPGRHRLTARLVDSARETGYDYERDEDIDLVAGQNLVIDFQAEAGGFIFR